MNKIHAVITGVAGYLPDYILTNEELSRMVDTSDEWIMTRIGIKERHILKDLNSGSSDLAVKAIERLLEKTHTRPEEIDFILCATVTPDMQFPSTANIIADKLGILNGFGYDINAGCSGFLYALASASKWVESGSCKKVIVVGCEKMSSIVDYTDRATCPIFGDGAGAVLLEPTTENIGILDCILHSDGSGRKHLHQKAGGSLKPASHETVDAREHFIYQEGQAVYKHAVSRMYEVNKEICEKNNLSNEDISWYVPHQANKRIITSLIEKLQLDPDKVMINIERFGNTTAATLPLCLWEWERKMKKGDNVILSAFGAGFAWGAIYLKWAYDSK
ncbi:MAG: ketoacyl-ACP synthase III [Bacteroidales bacterium]|jgi:3-oxoacyl-[acyl-carrier-protein] synthase-3|nr:ketoacyl-ACP synthase III [Bacteroidales bacterium]